MRSPLALAFGCALLLAPLAACAGPRLVGREPTARLPAPAVRRVEGPVLRTEGVAWPLHPPAETICDT
jgi:hypothetical protein